MKGTKRYWAKEEKLRIINRVIKDGISQSQVSREENINVGLLSNWIKKYTEQGEKALENKKKQGNPVMKYQMKKTLNDLEKLEYENMKLRIENERLKKGYVVKGDGSVVIFK